MADLPQIKAATKELHKTLNVPERKGGPGVRHDGTRPFKDIKGYLDDIEKNYIQAIFENNDKDKRGFYAHISKSTREKWEQFLRDNPFQEDFPDQEDGNEDSESESLLQGLTTEYRHAIVSNLVMFIYQTLCNPSMQVLVAQQLQTKFGPCAVEEGRLEHLKELKKILPDIGGIPYIRIAAKTNYDYLQSASANEDNNPQKRLRSGTFGTAPTLVWASSMEQQIEEHLEHFLTKDVSTHEWHMSEIDEEAFPELSATTYPRPSPNQRHLSFAQAKRYAAAAVENVVRRIVVANNLYKGISPDCVLGLRRYDLGLDKFGNTRFRDFDNAQPAQMMVLNELFGTAKMSAKDRLPERQKSSSSTEKGKPNQNEKSGGGNQGKKRNKNAKRGNNAVNKPGSQTTTFKHDQSSRGNANTSGMNGDRKPFKRRFSDREQKPGQHIKEDDGQQQVLAYCIVCGSEDHQPQQCRQLKTCRRCNKKHGGKCPCKTCGKYHYGVCRNSNAESKTETREEKKNPIKATPVATVIGQ